MMTPAEYKRKRRKARRKMLLAILGGACIQCGKKRHLNFDHIDSSKKNFDIANAYDKPMDTIMDELKNCQLLCITCHRKKTFENAEHGQNPRQHGTLHHYRNLGCRCDKCKAAAREYNQSSKKKRLKALKKLLKQVK